MESLEREFGIPSAVKIIEGIGGLPKVVLTHPSGSSSEVYLHGAHVTSWKNRSGGEIFFVSRESAFATDLPIRGGIPVIFPQFGGGLLPAHGFARISDWRLSRSSAEDGVKRIELRLSESPRTLAMWPHRFELTLGVVLAADSLTVSMQVENTDEQAFEFQSVFHTYFGVADIGKTGIRGLEGITYVDDLKDQAREVETRSTIRFAEETDRVYVAAPDCVELDDEGHSRVIRIEKRNMSDVVVWNPWIAKSQRMPDFGDDEYQRMVCVETGCIESRVKLSPGKEWCGGTIFTDFV